MSIGISVCKRGGKRPSVENSDWARSWKQRIQPRFGLKAVEPVLYPHLIRIRALSQYACLTPLFRNVAMYLAWMAGGYTLTELEA